MNEKKKTNTEKRTEISKPISETNASTNFFTLQIDVKFHSMF